MTNKRYIDSNKELKTRFVLEGSMDKEHWFMIHDASERDDDRSHPYLILNEEYEVRYLRVSVIELPYHEVFALSGFRVFGVGKGEKPEKVRNILVAREGNGMDCHIRFSKAKGAIGYNIRFGIAKDKLYSSFMVYEETEILLTTLNAYQPYYIAIDSFNENGVTEAEEVYYITK